MKIKQENLIQEVHNRIKQLILGNVLKVVGNNSGKMA